MGGEFTYQPIWDPKTVLTSATMRLGPKEAFPNSTKSRSCLQCSLSRPVFGVVLKGVWGGWSREVKGETTTPWGFPQEFEGTRLNLRIGWEEINRKTIWTRTQINLSNRHFRLVSFVGWLKNQSTSNMWGLSEMTSEKCPSNAARCRSASLPRSSALIC